MNPNQFIKDYFTFNRKEQRGLLVLVGLFIALLIGNMITPYLKAKESFDNSAFAKEVTAFERELAKQDSIDSIKKKESYTKRYKNYGSLPIDSSKPFSRRVEEVFYIDLNTADTLDLQRLRGIGPGFARKIVSYRERLGGFKDKSQVLEVYGMDTARFNMIKDHLLVSKDSVKKMDLNLITFKEMMRHPYFPFVITKAIMIYRIDHKKFQTLEELRKIEVINDSVFRRISPYIMVR